MLTSVHYRAALMKTPSLAALLSPFSTTEFLAHLKSGTPLFCPRAEEVGLLTNLDFLASLESLLRAWPYTVSAHLPKIADEASAIEVNAQDAAKLFDNGLSLLFDNAQRISVELETWLEAIRRDLGFSSLTQSRCLLYATPKGKGTAPHFDQNTNFVLQLHGTKKWWLAPNQNVTNPLSRHTMGLPTDGELATYAQTPWPLKMPSDAQCIELQPGSLLFVPSGVWHTTLAQSDALSLNFTYHAPAWLDLFTSALRSRLALSPAWRATAHGVSDPDRRLAANEEFETLLQELVLDLPHWQAAQILEATD